MHAWVQVRMHVYGCECVGVYGCKCVGVYMGVWVVVMCNANIVQCQRENSVAA
jgi:hypothetical protein